MVENYAFAMGLLAGLILGGFAVGVWLSTRLRNGFQIQLVNAVERAQRAETLAEELRRCRDADQDALDRVRRELAETCRGYSPDSSVFIETGGARP